MQVTTAWKKRLLIVAIAAASGAAAATPITYTGGTVGGDQGAIATFEFTGSTLVLTLTNTSNITDIASILDDFHFLLSATPTSAGFSSITSAGTVDCTASTNSVSNCSTNTSSSGTDNTTGTWGIFLTGAQVDMYSSGNQIHPYGIVNDSLLSQANLDGLRNGQHNPYLMGPVTFNISLAGLTGATTVSNVDFTFGTQPLHVPGTRTPPPSRDVPEPATLALLGLGLLGLRRRFGVH